MRQLFSMDARNYNSTMRRFVRPSARAIILRKDKIELVYVSTMGYYKFPGGGIEPGEDPKKALIRETHEEAGLTVIESSIKEYGMVHRIEYHSEHGDVFDQKNFYYFCEVEQERSQTELTETEREKGFIAVLENPQSAVEANRTAAKRVLARANGYDGLYAESKEIEREGRVLELLIAEGFFKDL